MCIIKYDQALKFLQRKLAAYKTEYIKEKQLAKQRENAIASYEKVLKYMSKRKATQQKERDQESHVYEQILQRVKSEYENELRDLRNGGDRSLSPILHSPLNTSHSNDRIEALMSQIRQSAESNPQPFQNEIKRPAKMSTSSCQTEAKWESPKKEVQQQTKVPTILSQTQTDIDDRIALIESLREIEQQLSKERDTLVAEKKDLLIEKLNFNTRLSEIQQRYEATQELLDAKAQKHKDLKHELKRIRDEGQDRDSGLARLKEEIATAEKLKLEAEGRSKKFESKFRQALKELDDLREQQEKANEDDLNINNDNLSFLSSSAPVGQFGSYQMQSQFEGKLAEVEKEKEFLQQRVAQLEKSNKELLQNQRQLEEIIRQVMQEPDDQKRLMMINSNHPLCYFDCICWINLSRRKSLLRIESSKMGAPKAPPADPEDLNSSSGGKKNVSGAVAKQLQMAFFPGQKQSNTESFMPGSNYQINNDKLKYIQYLFITSNIFSD